jgi:hypothetical protein
MKTLYLLGYFLVKLLIALPICWWLVMSVYGVWICVDYSNSASDCVSTILLTPIIAALPAISDGEDRLEFRLAVLSVPIITVLTVLVWEFASPVMSRFFRWIHRNP